MWRSLRKHHRLMLSYTRAIVRSLVRPAFVYLIFASATVIAANAGLFWWLEHEVNPRLETFLDALYYSVATTTTVGFGDIVPLTHAGKALAIVSMLLGSGLFVAFTAVLASSIIDLELRAARGDEPSD